MREAEAETVRHISRRRSKRNSYGRCRVWTYMDVYGRRPIATGLANSGPGVTTADVYPASLCGLSDHRREPRWIFARFPLNGAKALAEAMPVQTPGSGSDGVTVSPSSANRCNCWARPIDPFGRDFPSLRFFRLRKLKDWDRKRYR